MNRHILVTGAASGIGLAVATRLAAPDARLILVDRDGEGLARVDLPGAIERAAGDVADEAFWNALAPRLAGLTGAVINAGWRERGRSRGSTSPSGGESWRSISTVRS